MGVKKFRPTTPSLRFTVLPDFVEITKDRPEKGLIEAKQRTGGRNAYGRMTSRHRGGGHKKMYRRIDFRRDRENEPARVVGIEYDPNRTARIALLEYPDGERRYILAPNGLRVSDEVMTGASAEIKIGNCLPLSAIPIGMPVHNVELRKGTGAQMVRSAGSAAELLAKEGAYAHVKLPSGEVRRVPLECRATIGQVGHVDHVAVSLGKAGRARWLGRRPHVRGVAMNPVDHPMGGGEGKSSGGRHPCSPWGQLAKGLKTRRKNKSLKHVVKPRRAKR